MPSPVSHNSKLNYLADRLITSSELRTELMSKLADLADLEFQNRVEKFKAGLTPQDQAIFETCQVTPYAAKDWWRNPHDIYVVQSLQIIVEEERLPAWLVTAAILHDRGYGILASQSGEESQKYLQKSGAHWESPDTRIVHSLLSRKFSEELIFAPTGKFFEGRAAISEPELFLKVIETHDHPLIGKFNELPKIGRHHFDADSLFSISLYSFVKDYLSYLGDPKKLEKAKDLLDLKDGRFEAKDLLVSRLARYYPNTEILPNAWDLEMFPLIAKLAAFSEAGKCLPPSSITAQALTDESFRDLAECCQVLAKSNDLPIFINWLADRATTQFSKVQSLLDSKRLN